MFKCQPNRGEAFFGVVIVLSSLWLCSIIAPLSATPPVCDRECHEVDMLKDCSAGSYTKYLYPECLYCGPGLCEHNLIGWYDCLESDTPQQLAIADPGFEVCDCTVPNTTAVEAYVTSWGNYFPVTVNVFRCIL